MKIDPSLLDETLQLTDDLIELTNHGCGCKYEQIVTKATGDEPDFKADPNKGEGKATALEMEYNQQIKDLIKKVWDNRTKSDEKIHQLIQDNITEGQKYANEFLTKVFNTNTDLAIKKLKKIGINKPKPKKSPEQLTALIEWQQFAIYKLFTELELGIINQRKGKTSLEASYGTKKAA